MASTATQIAVPAAAGARVSPLVLWHLLSLDAPTVAAVWTWFLARAAGIPLPAASVAAMFLAVWILYAADRLLDARLLDDDRLLDAGPLHPAEPLEARHRFHHRHRRRYRIGILCAGVALAALIPRLPPAALRLYLVEGGVLALWFAILHATPIARRLPKECVVGLFFATAVFIPTIARRPELRGAMLPGLALLAALCTLNCLFIHTWEHMPHTRAHAIARFASRHISGLALLAAGLDLGAGLTTGLGTSLGAGLAGFALPRAVPAACALAALLLLALHRTRARMDRTTLRAAADLVLLTPLLVLPFVR